jgi:hypothetical protein
MKMKSYIAYAFAALAVFLHGCEETDSKGLSRLTYYAVITLEGEQWNSIPVGGSWTDPGAKATEDGVEIDLVVGGDEVDTSTPGVYTIEYSAVNKDGYSSSEYRYIGVIDPTATADLTGKYKRDAGEFGISDVKKVEGIPNLYQTNNVGGVKAPSEATTVRFYYFEGSHDGEPGKIEAPYQLVFGSAFNTEDGVVNEGVSYDWVVINSGYGLALRHFDKQ